MINMIWNRYTKIDGISNSDMIDIRPRATQVSSVSEGDRSPSNLKEEILMHLEILLPIF